MLEEFIQFSDLLAHISGKFLFFLPMPANLSAISRNISQYGLKLFLINANRSLVGLCSNDRRFIPFPSYFIWRQYKKKGSLTTLSIGDIFLKYMEFTVGLRRCVFRKFSAIKENPFDFTRNFIWRDLFTPLIYWCNHSVFWIIHKDWNRYLLVVQ